MSIFIYLISNEFGYSKVGVSKHPKKRVKELQTGNNTKLELIFTEEFTCTRKNLLKIERKIHREMTRLAQKQIGEWFYIEDHQLDTIKNTIIWHRIRYDENPWSL